MNEIYESQGKKFIRVPSESSCGACYFYSEGSCINKPQEFVCVNYDSKDDDVKEYIFKEWK